MPYVFLTASIRQKLDEFRIFLAGCDYQESTIVSYHTYVSKYLRSNHYNKKGTGLKEQIDEFLQGESKKAPKTFKCCRAALYAYFKSQTGSSYSRVLKRNTNNMIEELLDGFREFQKSVKQMAEATITAEANQAGTFLYCIYRQLPESFNASNINAINIRNYFAEEASYLKPSSKGIVATSIRNFFEVAPIAVEIEVAVPIPVMA